MAKVYSISSDDTVKYVTVEKNSQFPVLIGTFLSNIGISREHRKNLYKNKAAHIRAGADSSGFSDTLQVVSNEDNTIRVEIYTGTSIIILSIHTTTPRQGEMIGRALIDIFEIDRGLYDKR